MPDPCPRSATRIALAAGLLLWSAPAQKPPAPGVDPFTRGDEKLMQAAGIEAYAPFPWAGVHGTADIERDCSLQGRMCWAETRHFKIGIQLRLPDRAWPEDKKEARELADEIDRLAKRLPAVKKQKGKPVTSWLLVHLYAQRLEALYADFCRQAGFADAAPPCVEGRGHDGRGFAARGGLGHGPYLGQHGKYCLLIFGLQSGLARYMGHFAQRDVKESVCHHFLESNSLVFVTTPELRTGALHAERALHCNVVYGMVRNFVTGLRGFTYEIPVWNIEGLAHWHRLRVDRKHNSIAALPENQWELLHDADWAAKARGRADNDAYAAAADLLRWQLQDLDDFHKHVMMWARVDFLLAQGEARYAQYLGMLKGLPIGAPWQQVLDQQDKALREVYGLDAAGFDAAWVAWVKKNYQR
jgi:hypothetical protein